MASDGGGSDKISEPQVAPADVPRYAVVLTAYAWDDFLGRQFEENARHVASGEMHVLIDESHGTIEVPAGLRKTSATQEAAQQLGLRIAYEKALFWHNLDYLYYIFFAEYPGYEYYVFLDYDARLLLDVDEMMRSISLQKIDFVGSRVVDDIDSWVYLAQHADIYPRDVIEAAISAVTVLSRSALQHLLAQRRRMSSSLPLNKGFWPFCEAFVPTELKLGGFRRAPLQDFGDTDHFAWWPPSLDEALPDMEKPGFLHPVLDRPRFIKSVLNHCSLRDFASPRGRLWKAMRSCVDRRWLMALPMELTRRLRRRVQRRQGRASTSAVGMSWIE